MSKEIGSYCSVAKVNTIIYPQQIEGYIAPEGQVLTENDQQFSFIYTPIQYNIKYELNGGEFSAQDTPKVYHTVEDEYTPPVPFKQNSMFTGWEPERLELKTASDITFEASWKDIAKLVPGPTLHTKIVEYMDNAVTVAIPTEKGTEFVGGTISDIKAIQIGRELPTGIGMIDVSITGTPIYMWYNNEVLFFYSGDNVIHCDSNMSGAFRDMVILRDISGLKDWDCPRLSDISNLFNGCTMLSDTTPVANWANGSFSSFKGAFVGTMAAQASTTPSWYKSYVTLYYKSTTGILLDTYSGAYIPGQTIYAKKISGYNCDTPSIILDDEHAAYDFLYTPIAYEIHYETYGGELLNPKESYTIEDESYTPPTPIREGYTFLRWSPSYIEHGSTGNITFIASYSGKVPQIN